MSETSDERWIHPNDVELVIHYPCYVSRPRRHVCNALSQPTYVVTVILIFMMDSLCYLINLIFVLQWHICIVYIHYICICVRKIDCQWKMRITMMPTSSLSVVIILTVKTGGYYDANFVVIGGTTDCQNAIIGSCNGCRLSAPNHYLDQCWHNGIPSATSGDKVGIMTTLGFQWRICTIGIRTTG